MPEFSFTHALIVLKFLIVSYIFRYLLERFEKSLYFFFQQALAETFKTNKSPEQNLNSGLLASCLSIFSKTLIALNWSYFSAGFVKKRRSIFFLSLSTFLSGAFLFIFVYLDSYSFFLVAMFISLILHVFPKHLKFIHELKSLFMTFSLLVGFFSLLPQASLEVRLEEVSLIYLVFALLGSFFIIGSFAGYIAFIIAFSSYQTLLPEHSYFLIPIVQLLEVFFFFKISEESDYKKVFSKLYYLQSLLNFSFLIVFILLGMRDLTLLYFGSKALVVVFTLLASKKIWDWASQSKPLNAKHRLSLPESYQTLPSATLIHLSEGHVFKTTELIIRLFDLSFKHVKQNAGAARSLAKIKEYETIIDRMTSELDEFLKMVLSKRMSKTDVQKAFQLSERIRLLEDLSDHLDKICSYYSQDIQSSEKENLSYSEKLGSVLKEMKAFFIMLSESHFNLDKKVKGERNQLFKRLISELREEQGLESSSLTRVSYRLSELRRSLKKV